MPYTMLSPKKCNLNAEHWLATREIQDLLQREGGGGDQSIRGIAVQDMEEIIQSSTAELVKSNVIDFLPDLELILREKCQEINSSVSLARIHQEPEPERLDGSFSAAEKLPATIKLAQARKEQWQRQGVELDRLHLLMDNVIAELHDTVTAFKMLDQPKAKELKADYLDALSCTIQSKVRLISHKLLLETYTSDRIEQLESKRAKLLAVYTKSKAENSKLHMKLRRYQDTDQGFRDMVSQYSLLLQQVQEREEWLKSLQQTDE